MRVHILAKELNVSSKTIIDKCKAEGIDTVKNHMSTLSAGLHATILEWFSEGKHDTVVETADRVDLAKARIKHARNASGGAVTETIELEDEASAEDDTSMSVVEVPGSIHEVPTETISLEATPAPAVRFVPAAEPPALPVTEAVPSSSVPMAPSAPAIATSAGGESAPRAEETATATTVAAEVAAPPAPIRPAGPQNVPAAAKLKGPRVVRYEAPEPETRAPRPGMRRGPGPGVVPGPTRIDATPGRSNVVEPGEDAEAAKKRGKPGDRRTGTARPVVAADKIAEWRNRDLEERKERLAGATGRRIHRRKSAQPAVPAGPTGPKSQAAVHEPIRMKEFCAETGLNFVQLFKVLKDEYNILANVNMLLPTETAQLLALHYGISLEVVPAKTQLDELREEYEQLVRTSLRPRPPVVTLLGHVDHGKTSLMDRIRTARVAAGEDGGITQHIGSYHLETSHGAVTFLDTPGHEAFSAMRARGAELTDVVVLVIAADDGVMPQTVEAIKHAQAAKVPIVVALNKIDLGDQNKLKIFGQLSEHGLAPSEWGGEVDVIPTSATTGAGVQELIEHLANLSSLLELRADPTLPARATVIDAETKPGVGSVAHVLVQEGTLRVGDIVVCGNSFGKIRVLMDDRGRRLDEALPGMPVEVWGLGDVPAAGDSFYAVDDPQRAKEIATETSKLRVERGRLDTRKLKSLEDLLKRRRVEEAPELNLVLKADVDGSLSALKTSLADIPSDEVRLTIRHAAVGAVNDSDILLAAASSAIIAAFRVEVSAGAKRLGEQHGVDIRAYRVIYDVCDDIRKALSGMLAPEIRIEARATVEVRQVFRVGKVGVVAGSYVSQGLVDRSHLARLIRDGVVLREGAKIGSLRHLKDDVREVRAGMECGIRLEGFDDVHTGDRIETYEVIKIARTL